MGRFSAVLIALLTGFGLLAPVTAQADQTSQFVFEKFRDGPLEAGPFWFQLNPNYMSDKTLKPQGQFLVIHMDVTNIGRRPATFVANYQTLSDFSGRVFAPSTTAGLRETGESQIADINPGNKFSAGLVFDVPAGTALRGYMLTLRASADSSGISFQLPVGEVTPTPPPLSQGDVNDYARSRGLTVPYPEVPPGQRGAPVG